MEKEFQNYFYLSLFMKIYQIKFKLYCQNNKKFYENKLNILITGSGGYISSHILKSKIIKRHNVKLVYRKNKPKFNLDNFELFKIDLTKKKFN